MSLPLASAIEELQADVEAINEARENILNNDGVRQLYAKVSQALGAVTRISDRMESDTSLDDQDAQTYNNVLDEIEDQLDELAVTLEDNYSFLVEEYSDDNGNEQQGIRLTCLDDYAAEGPPELSAKRGEVVWLIDEDDGNGWTYVQSEAGEGYLPTSYLVLTVQTPDTHRLSQMPLKEYQRQAQRPLSVAVAPTACRQSILHRAAPSSPPRPRSEPSLATPTRRPLSSPRTPGQPITMQSVLEASPALSQPSDASSLLSARATQQGFRPSLLVAVAEQHDIVTQLGPMQDSTGWKFEDLDIDASTQQWRTTEVSLLKTLKLVEAKNVPSLPEDEDLELDYRMLYVTVYDNQAFECNVATAHAHCKKSEHWRWDKSSGLPGTTDSDGLMIVRADGANPRLSLVFELVAWCHGPHGRVPVSHGWASLNLFQAGTTTPVANKTYTLTLQGGTALERGVTLNDGAPKLTVKLSGLNKAAKSMCDSLPINIVTQLTSVTMISLYRDCLANALHERKLEPGSVTTSTLINNFPLLMEDTQLMSLFKQVWERTLKLLKKSQKKNLATLRATFELTFSQKIYPLLYMRQTQAQDGDLSTDALRERELLLRQFAQHDVMEELAKDYSNDHEETHLHMPFVLDELCYSV